ncbi:mRNA-decapping enzyme 1A-like [Chironomus tepperi]|uniref:mRNA-decapping enzyme 1A-like n=1 Tax=Chironomus tepperi TaxID=113505 RepID=UPI00391FBD28
MDESAKLRMNLVAIQKVDPYAKEIVDSCSHVAYYKYVSNEWQKTEIEGAFFIYSRVAEPFQSIFINNRLSTTSLVEPVTKTIELQSNPPFLLYRNVRSAISGFWFYEKQDCVRIYGVLEKLTRKTNPNNSEQQDDKSKQTPVDPEKQQQQNQHNGTNNENKRDVDIFSMLSKAQAEFTNSGTTPTINVEQKFAEMNINKAHHVPQHQPLMKQMSNVMPDITSPNVVSFFAAAQQPTNGMIPIIDSKQGGPQFLGSSNCIPINQPPMTVDQLEKQHRVTSKSPRADQNLLNNLLQPSSSPQPMNLLQQPGMTSNMQAQKPTLITPVMFQASNIEDKAILNAQQSNNIQGMSNNIRLEPLTQNQLMQALNYLLENDPEFIRKIHEAYVKSFNKIITL